MADKIVFSFILTMIAIISIGQDILIDEDFDDCMLPSGWTMEVTEGKEDGVTFGEMINRKSDSLSIDGTCMLVFDDDILGGGAPFFRAELLSPIFNIEGYSSVELSMDFAFREYGTSFMEIFVVVDGMYHTVSKYGEDNGTGSSFSNAIKYRSDLSFIVDSGEIQIAVVYDDDEMYAWWGGVDNIVVIGKNEGETILIENFDGCELPTGWTSEILKGEHDWQFGQVTNDNSTNQSMNGSCFAYFDDDGIGGDAPFSTVELRSPVFDGSQFAEFILKFDIILRKAGAF